MDNSLKVGRYILEVLEDNNELTELLGENKIFPIVAPEGTNYPIVIYSRDGLQVDYTKLHNWDNTVNISYKIYSPDYDEALNIANTIRNIIEKKTIRFEDIKINEIRLIGCYETFVDDVFCETLSFQTSVE